MSAEAAAKIPQPSSSDNMAARLLTLFRVPRELSAGALRSKLLSPEFSLNGLERVYKRDSLSWAIVSFASPSFRESAADALKAQSSTFGCEISNDKDIKQFSSWAAKTQEEAGSDDTLPSSGAKRGNDSDDLSNKKRKFGDNKGGSSSSSSSQQIIQVVCPLAHLPYEQQLKTKHTAMTEVLRSITSSVQEDYSKSPTLAKPEWLKTLLAANPAFASYVPPANPKLKQKKGTRPPPRAPLACSFEGVTPSPQPLAYRNKNEFTCGINSEGKATTGFLQGRFSDGLTGVESPNDCPHISDISKQLAQRMSDYMQSTIDTLEPYKKTVHKGFWRLVTVRETMNGECMVIVQVNPTDVPTEQMTEIKSKLVQHFFTEASTPTYKVVSLYLQLHSGVSNVASEDAPLELLAGQEFITESLLGLKFRISPTSFFQIHARGAEVLYSQVGEWVREYSTPKTVLLDVCSGTGTIGQILSKDCGRVLGVEICAPAVENAKQNAIDNGITNTKYICGKAEDVLGDMLIYHVPFGADCVAVVDPARSGLHPKVIKALRKCKELKSLIYVSCNPQQLVADAIQLCRPDGHPKTPGKPFRPVRSKAVDMFPQTSHCEMIVVFEREAPAAVASSSSAGPSESAAVEAVTAESEPAKAEEKVEEDEEEQEFHDANEELAQ